MVSVIIRTIGRVELQEALDSVAAQLYPRIEIVLVDAKGTLDFPTGAQLGHSRLRVASAGVPLGRSAAANLGLDTAQGDLILFLDDDDWLLPDHISSLVAAIKENPGVAAAYSGIECRSRDASGTWQSIYTFNQPYDRTRLLVENYLPIHSVLFAHALIGEGLRFDESFDVYEDWDFWIQLSALTDLVHLNSVSGIYRISPDGGFGLRSNDPAIDRGKRALFRKWRERWDLDQVMEITEYAKYRSRYLDLRTHDERLETMIVDLSTKCESCDRDLARFREEKVSMNEQYQKMQEHDRQTSAQLHDAQTLLRLVGVETIDDAIALRRQLGDIGQLRLLLDDCETRRANETLQHRAELARLETARDVTHDCLAAMEQRVLNADDAASLRADLIEFRRDRHTIEERQRHALERIETLISQAQGLEDNLIRRLNDLRGGLFWRSVQLLRRFDRAAGRLVDMTAAGSMRLRHIGILAREYGPNPVLRAGLMRVAGSRLSLGPSLADLWQALDYAPPGLAASSTPSLSVLVDWENGIRCLPNVLGNLAALADAPAVEVLMTAPPRQPIARRIGRLTPGLTIVPVPNGAPLATRLRAGAEQAHSDWLLLVGDAEIASEEGLSPLLDLARRDPDIHAVCSRVIGRDGRLVHAGALRCAEGEYVVIGAGDDPNAPEYNYVRQVDLGSPDCLLLSRRAILALDAPSGPPRSDEESLRWLFEQFESRGWRLLYQPAIDVRVADSSSRNEQRDWRNCVGAAKRVLVIDAVMPTPDQDSGSLRMFNLLESFCDLGWHVTFVPSNLELEPPYGPRLQQRGIEVVSRPGVESIPDLLAARGTTFELVVLSRADIAHAYMGSVRHYAPQASVWYDTVDLHFLREQREAELLGDPVARERATMRKAQELELMTLADLTLVVSPAERDLLGSELPTARVEILSNIHDLEPTAAPFAERDAIIFIGGFNHPPNVDAIRYYAEEILPGVHSELGPVPTLILGSKPPPEVLALADPLRGISVVGYVRDAKPFFERARLSIAPLRYGAGVKGKINMSMAFGVPVVATHCAAEGMFLQPGRDVLLADDPSEFAAKVVRLYRDRALWESLATNGLGNIERFFSRDVARRAIQSLAEKDAS